MGFYPTTCCLAIKVRFKLWMPVKMWNKNNFNSKLDYVDLVNLVRSIQRAEGNPDCYRRGRQQCDRMSCVWRDHCLESPRGGGVGVGCESQAK